MSRKGFPANGWAYRKNLSDSLDRKIGARLAHFKSTEKSKLTFPNEIEIALRVSKGFQSRGDINKALMKLEDHLGSGDERVLSMYEELLQKEL